MQEDAAVMRRLVGKVSAVKLAEEVTRYFSLYGEARPHESLVRRPPLVMQRADQHLFEALTLQEPRHGTR
jgi:hypothetical protein